MQCIGEDVGRCGDVIQKSRSPQVHVLRHMEPQKPVVERLREHVKAIDLSSHAQPDALILDVSNSQARSLQQRRQIDAGVLRPRTGKERHQPGTTRNRAPAFGRVACGCAKAAPSNNRLI